MFPSRYPVGSQVLANIIATYDIQFEEGKVPREYRISYLLIPGNTNRMFIQSVPVSDETVSPYCGKVA